MSSKLVRYSMEDLHAITRDQARRLVAAPNIKARVFIGSVQAGWDAFTGDEICVTLRWNRDLGAIFVDMVIPSNSQTVDTLIDSLKSLMFRKVCEDLGVIHSSNTNSVRTLGRG